jgi:hypothetical protein
MATFHSIRHHQAKSFASCVRLRNMPDVSCGDRSVPLQGVEKRVDEQRLLLRHHLVGSLQIEINCAGVPADIPNLRDHLVAWKCPQCLPKSFVRFMLRVRVQWQSLSKKSLPLQNTTKALWPLTSARLGSP